VPEGRFGPSIWVSERQRADRADRMGLRVQEGQFDVLK